MNLVELICSDLGICYFISIPALILIYGKINIKGQSRQIPYQLLCWIAYKHLCIFSVIISRGLGKINEAKLTVATAANSSKTILYRNIGYRINTEILSNKRADYGKQIIVLLSK